MTEVVLGSVVFVIIVLVLASLVLIAQALLLPSGRVNVRVNNSQEIEARAGDKLLATLADSGIAIPASCGGAGTCGQCRVHITDGRSPALPTETALLSRAELGSGLRLACQTTLRADLSVELPDSLLHATTWECTVVSSRTIAPIIREIVLAPAQSEPFIFSPGAFVQIEIPAYEQQFSEYVIAAEHRDAWDALGLHEMCARSAGGVMRAYSLANRAVENAGQIALLIRLALPPSDRLGLPPGEVSSYLFGLHEGDRVQVTGPFGSFAAQETEREMVFIGGGVGMAPLRAIITDQLEVKKTTRKMSFWYGARSLVDLFYEDEFERLQATHPNFRWTAALSDPGSHDDWHGETGFVHEVALQCGLAAHPAPHDCEYYLCGPPMMITAVLAMLDELGVDRDRIFNDDFGG